MAKRRTELETEQQTSVAHRISIGLIALSISLFSLALGTALFMSPSATFLFMPGDVSLQAAPSSATAITLTWTAPGDDNNVGTAASYDIRYSTSPLSEGTFASATAMVNPPVPSIAGSTETTTVTGLQPATTYFFALKATDESGNVSAMSNIATKATDALPVACIPIYSCTEWTSCVAGIQTKTCVVTNGCPAGLDAPITTQSCTVPTPTPTPTPGVGGTPVHVVNNVIVAGLAPGNLPMVHIIDPKTKKVTKEFTPFSTKDRNGVFVAAGDFTGDSQADIAVGTGAGSDPLVAMYTPAGKKVLSFNPYPTDKKIGVSVAAGDVDGDGIDELITVPAKSASQVRVWKYDSTAKKFKQLAQLMVFDRTVRTGFTVAAGDMNLDGRAEIVVAPRANGRKLIVIGLDVRNSLQVMSRITAFPINFSTGLNIAVGDVYGTGRSVIAVTSGPNYYTHIKVYDMYGKTLADFLPVSKGYHGGETLATQDINNDGRDEILMANQQGAEPMLRAFRYNGVKRKFDQIQSYLVFPRTIKTGVRLGGT